jgi:hypothetical protein
MMVARFYRSITEAALAFEGGFPALTLDVRLQARGMVHEPADRRQRLDRPEAALRRIV